MMVELCTLYRLHKVNACQKCQEMQFLDFWIKFKHVLIYRV